MTRLQLLVEGQTEEQFVTQTLAPHLQAAGVFAEPIVVATSRDRRTGRKHRGGGHWRQWHADLQRCLPHRRDPDRRVTTMFDLYGLPADFPSRDALYKDPDAVSRAQAAERAIFEAAGSDPRLIPYVQIHEFEALVLASLDGLELWLDDEGERRGLIDLRREIGPLAPEMVNDGPSTAPSKRLAKHVPAYTKTLHGLGAIQEVGLATVRAACPRFDTWVRRLEQLGPEGAGGS